MLAQTIFSLFVLSILVVGMIPSFAEPVAIINIPSGAAHPQAPFFWQSEIDGDTSGNITIVANDSVRWENADTDAHTVTSGSPAAGPDGLFDSGLFDSGKFFSYTFDEIGNFPYYCVIHPWMVGSVTVTSGFKILPNVGSSAGDGKTDFDVEYQFNRIVTSATIHEGTNSIDFELLGQTKSDDHTLVMKLPTALIDGIHSVSIDGVLTDDFTTSTSVDDDGITILTVTSLTPTAKTVTVMGASVVPEFGLLSIMILAVGIISSIVLVKTRPMFRI